MRFWGLFGIIFFAVANFGCRPLNDESMPNTEISQPDKPNVKPINYQTPKPNQDANQTEKSVPHAENLNLAALPRLIIPVQGVQKSQLRDTFKDARSEGRVHDSIDIIAPLGTPVLAASDGEIAKFFDSERGGITIYQFSPDKKIMLYYAHLQKRADNLKVGDFVKQGTVVGYVGETGNATSGNAHLHFSIWIITDEKRNWDGQNLNPYPILMNAK